MSSEDKLAILKEVHNKSFILERSKQELKTQLTNVIAEDKCLTDYLAELSMMEKEKAARLEEVRQLDNDMECVRVLVDQANMARDDSYKGACGSFKQFVSVKNMWICCAQNVWGWRKVKN